MEYLAVMVTGLLLGGWAVPLGFALGLGPLATFAAAAGGGLVGCWAFLLAGDRISALARRLGRSDGSDVAETDGVLDDEPGDESTGSAEDSGGGRITELVDRFGVRGLGIIGPIFPGVTASVIGGLAIGIDRRSLGRWMTIGIIVMYGLYVIGVTLLIELW
jgi:hypothetical protein